ncbi:uroporphyrinogen-III synthase [Bacillus sp. Marseille-P3800]|uniref:uroporphyrinogen-III synthase n=1 Tax=Bacillus sp. Marseille-P3800 TaxID=2014782 RepID=UPI000C079FAA|nr:uroporphyrinogen-III synthase [Bacillus sp. Marseille-P3800]
MELLSHCHIALTASRKVEEMQELIRKQGGTSEVRSMQGTVTEDEAIIKEMILSSLHTHHDWFVFTTGIGLQTFLTHAEQLGVKEAFIDKLRQARIAVRGYKAIAALKKEQIPYEVASEDGTTKGLLHKLDFIDFNDQKVIVQLYGIASPEMEAFFERKGAILTTWLPYHHYAPDGSVVDHLLNELMVKKVYHAICFTSALQVKALFEYAKKHGREEDLKSCFETDVIATAVGKVTAEALTESGVIRVVFPEKERMGAMIIHLGKYMEQYR